MRDTSLWQPIGSYLRNAIPTCKIFWLRGGGRETTFNPAAGPQP